MIATVYIRRGFPLMVTFDVCAPDEHACLPGGVEVDRIMTERGRDASFLKLTAEELRDIDRQCAESLCKEI
jgi:hypothetical protein